MGSAQQSSVPGRTTLLDAVNVLLRNIGEQPVNNLDNQQILDARIAEQTLLEFAKEGQMRGWSWNREEAYPFAVDPTSGEIKVSESAMTWLVDPYRADGRYVLRGTRVYDKKARSFQIDPNDSPLEADVVWLLSWDECPEAFNRWTTIRAARVYSTRMLGSDSVTNYTAVDEQAALTELMRMETEQAQPNSLTGGPFSGPMPTYSPEQGLRRSMFGGNRVG
jgi:hypothetical protein